MIGFPKYLNTKEDFEYLHARALAGEISLQSMLQQWEGLLSGAYCYQFDRNLGAAESPDGPAPDYVLMEIKQEDGSIIRRQEKRVRDVNARLDALGFTEAEVQSKISELGA